MSTAGLLEFGVLGKPGACWRALTKDKGFAGRKAPTKSPASRENPERVGVPRRRRKALRGGRRQQSRRRVGKILSVLACPDEGERFCREEGANKETRGSGKS